MPKKTLTILIISFSVVVIGLFAAAFFLSRNAGAPSGIATSTGGSLFPVESGGRLGGVGMGTTSQTGVGAGGIAAPLPALRQITSVPVAGAIPFARNGKTYVRYVEKSTGNVYETDAASFGNNRLTNTTIPRVARALWGKSGSQVIIEYLDENTAKIKNFGAKINEEKKTLEGAFLRDAISEMAVAPDTDRIFYTVPFGADTIGSVANFDGTKTTNLLTSPFSEWLVSWPYSKIIAFATKPSFAAVGYLYFLNTQTDAFDKIVGGVSGLSALVSPDGKYIAYSESVENSFTLNLFAVSDKTSSRLPVSTLSEKCVWANDAITLYCAAPSVIPPGGYPDVWYQGLVSFSDTIWKMNTKTGFVDLVIAAEDSAREPIDVIQPTLSPDGGYLIFINKKDQSLWSLKLAS